MTLLAVILVACDRGGPPEPTQPGTSTDASGTDQRPQPPTGKLEDVVESTSDYVIGISYAPVVSQYPGLAAEIERYANAARAELLAAVEERGSEEEGALYDLSLSFTEVLDSPDLVAVAADGSSYTGGAHGMPLLARFVWLPRQERMLEAIDLIPDQAGWRAVARHVREQLHTAVSQRADADRLDPDERSEVVGNAGDMIDEGTTPDPANFANFEPVTDGNDRITALRFVFAPYDVGPYSDGVQTVQVPAAVLLPHVADEYRELFDDGSE